MSDNAMDSDNWIFDSLVNFLHGNIWKMPVLGFIEDKSVVFDPDSYSNLSDEKEEEFRRIHEEYKGLVDFMLSSFMDDLQVTPEQVEEACMIRESQQTIIPDSHITKVALEQLQAAEDFMIFRRIMTRKNIDLQLQSLELLVAKYGVLSPSMKVEGNEEGDEDDDFLQLVIRYCDQLCDCGKEVHCTLHLGHGDKDKPPQYEDLVQIEQTRSDLTGLNIDVDTDGPKTEAITPPVVNEVSEANKFQSDSQLKEQEISPSNDRTGHHVRFGTTEVIPDKVEDKDSGLGVFEEGPSKSKESKDTKYGNNKGAEKMDKEALSIVAIAPQQHRTLTSVRKALETDGDADLTVPSEGSSNDDLNKRRAYLRAQRDKLVTLKKRERERQLEQVSQSTRPKSARAAQMALRGPPTSSGEKSLAARRALAARLKQELIGPKKE